MRRVNISDIYRRPSTLTEDLPIQVMRNGKVACEVVKPGCVWRECEKCGESTQNHIDYEGKDGWEMIVLCDRCQQELI